MNTQLQSSFFSQSYDVRVQVYRHLDESALVSLESTCKFAAVDFESNTVGCKQSAWLVLANANLIGSLTVNAACRLAVDTLVADRQASPKNIYKQLSTWHRRRETLNQEFCSDLRYEQDLACSMGPGYYLAKEDPELLILRGETEQGARDIVALLTK